MMEKIQRFGSAMLAPVLIFAVAGLAVGLSVIALNADLVGGIAEEGTWWFSFWTVWQSGAWTIFNQMEILFVLGLPIALAKKAQGRAVLEAGMVYLTFQYFVSSLLELFGDTFGVDFSADPGGSSGLKLVAGIKTLDTGILGAIIISAIVVWAHNRWFEKKLPDFLGIFQGTQFVYGACFLLMLPFALLTCFVWPIFQHGIASMQGFFVESGVIGVAIYTTLERLLIPTGLHHFVYTPFVFGPAVYPDGIQRTWIDNLSTFANSDQDLRTLFPGGGFALHGNSKVFGAIGICLAFYSTAFKERRKEVLSLLIPVCLTAVLIGITEPLEFTFLFAAPLLFVLHAILAGLMSSTMYAFGVSGNFGGGLIDFLFQNWIPLWSSHYTTYLIQIFIGLSFTVIYFLLFRFLILKLNLKTPGREDEGKDIHLYSKKEYRERKKQATIGSTTAAAENNTADGEEEDDSYAHRARGFLRLLGGQDNIASVTNCATRLRVTVHDETLVSTSDGEFKEAGALGIVRKGSSYQVIVGMDVPQVRDRFEELLHTTTPESASS
ncbi:PTS alpha-glucoside transporter subunit IIBC [Corynebacterium poyangense]|uniref:PTS alpha-glucoside transporter subunit IIBC n=1 Tax=Corynebacterium poyangense TaxID=2684405 RepID=A0A7H0SRL3_9CORY|nr:alpha-glucoside-specific PTS transporter subunit IIBC [Corynebacterium poyangense]MBZ8176620.1 PTS transporter subunit EIIC [Corynebacterium poyangense]QNQ91188.1 PTS alpha-glucoside transporter subunit IIBC [Corynebacterium poyangense]